MTTNLPPSYTFGAFNPAFFSSSYLEYPIAQGQETISKLLTTKVDTINPANNVTLFDSTTTGNITIGAGLTTGNLILSNGLTLGNANGITCGTTSYTPIISQLGYTNTKSTSVLTATTTSQFFCSMFGLIKGIYILYINAVSSNATNASAVCQIFQQSISGCNTTLDPYNVGCNGLNAVIPVCFIGILNVTSNSQSIVFNCAMTPTGTIQFNNINCTAVRIA